LNPPFRLNDEPALAFDLPFTLCLMRFWLMIEMKDAAANAVGKEAPLWE
jgi:hypothetical protein